MNILAKSAMIESIKFPLKRQKNFKSATLRLYWIPVWVNFTQFSLSFGIFAMSLGAVHKLSKIQWNLWIVTAEYKQTLISKKSGDKTQFAISRFHCST